MAERMGYATLQASASFGSSYNYVEKPWTASYNLLCVCVIPALMAKLPAPESSRKRRLNHNEAGPLLLPPCNRRSGQHSRAERLARMWLCRTRAVTVGVSLPPGLSIVCGANLLSSRLAKRHYISARGVSNVQDVEGRGELCITAH